MYYVLPDWTIELANGMAPIRYRAKFKTYREAMTYVEKRQPK